MSFLPRGVIPACLLPFDNDLQIDEAGFRAHLRDLVSVRGVTGITVNGHSMEMDTLDVDERLRALDVAREEIPAGIGLVCGLSEDGSLHAARMAARATAAGADAFLVFPSSSFAWGGSGKRDMVVSHLERIADATDRPLVLFQYPAETGLAYDLDTLVAAAERVPTLCAIKDFVGNGQRHERQIRVLRQLDRPVATLTTHSSWLLGSLALGADGLLSGAGSVIPDLQVLLFEAVRAGDLAAARTVNDRVHEAVTAFYAQPFADMHNRMKVALHQLGRLRSAAVRPPLLALSTTERAFIAEQMRRAGLTPDTLYRAADAGPGGRA